MKDDKTIFVSQYILPAFGPWATGNLEFRNRFAAFSKLHQVVKYQEIACPGPITEGCMWFSAEAMIHSFYYCPLKEIKRGTRIWKKRTFILFTPTSAHDEQRTDYLQALEAGQVLSISTGKLKELLVEFAELEQLIKQIAQDNASHYQQHHLFLTQATIARVKQLHDEHPLFIRLSNRDTQAMHVHLSKSGYLKLLLK